MIPEYINNARYIHISSIDFENIGHWHHGRNTNKQGDLYYKPIVYSTDI